VTSESLPSGSEIALLLMAVFGVATWLAINVNRNVALARFFAALGISSSVVLLWLVFTD
jgi:hypothetical protein